MVGEALFCPVTFGALSTLKEILIVILDLAFDFRGLNLSSYLLYNILSSKIRAVCSTLLAYAAQNGSKVSARWSAWEKVEVDGALGGAEAAAFVHRSI